MLSDGRFGLTNIPPLYFLVFYSFGHVFDMIQTKR